MADAEFEEKQFEFPATLELAAGGLIYSPGQVLEALLGFDVAMKTTHHAFWNLWGKPAVPYGSIIAPSWWGGLGTSAKKVPKRTGFELNLFVQWKRPERMTRSNASEWKTWNTAYYRYSIATPKKQLAALIACSSALGQNGLVVYGCPAFHTCNMLFTKTAKAELVASTNFVEASVLSGHKSYSYTQSGTNGHGHSAPKEVPRVDLLAEIRRRINASVDAEVRPDLDVVQRADQAARAAMRAASWPLPLSRFEERLKPVEDAVVGTVLRGDNGVKGTESVGDTERVIRAATRLAAFSWLTGVRWSVGALD